MDARIDIIGAGAFGTALGIAYARAGRQVTIWARAGAERLQAERENTRYLPGHRFPEGLVATGAFSDLTAEVAILAVPTQTLDEVLQTLRPRARLIVSTAKGLHFDTGLFPTALIARNLPDCIPAQLTGPSFAEDIATGLPTALTLACRDEIAGRNLQKTLHTDQIRPYISTDVLGAEIGGALKNVYAIACGAAMGAGLGLSARAALMTRGFAEMTRFATELGAQPATMAGLSGLGDLSLTCGSEMSRNFQFGHALGQGVPHTGASTVEGVVTAKAVVARARSLGVDMPIATEVTRLISGDVGVTEALGTLLARRLTSE